MTARLLHATAHGAGQGSDGLPATVGADEGGAGPLEPKAIPDPSPLYGQAVKQREGRRVVKVERKLVLGPPAADLAFISALLPERQNGTARSRNR